MSELNTVKEISLGVGQVKLFNNDTGEGVIETSNGKLVLLRRSNIIDDQFHGEGDKVAFTIVQGPNGSEAVMVSLF